MKDEFPHSAAARASTLPSRSILQWRQRELFPAIGRLHATGRFVYTRREIIQLRLLAEFVRWKIAPSSAAEFAGVVLSNLTDELVAPSPARKLILWVFQPEDDAESSDKLVSNVYFADEWFSQTTQPKLAQGLSSALYIPLSALIGDVDRALATPPRDGGAE